MTLFIISVALIVIAVHSFALISYSQTSNLSPSNATEWKAYVNQEVGFSFEYPSDWNLEEKQNRFETTTPDAAVSNGEIKFGAVKAIDRTDNNPLKPSTIKTDTEKIEESIARVPGNAIIEHANTQKYKIGGEKAGTFLVAISDEASRQAVQTFFVVHDGDGYMLNFSDSTETFDSPQTQNILNKILSSFKFLK